ncbi:MAG: ComEC/Rec2 family competence protein [Eubacteriales bacterium]
MTGQASPSGHGRIAACCGAFLLSCYVSVKGHTALAVVLTVLSAVLVLLSILLRGRTRLAARVLPVVCFIFAAALLSLLHRTLFELPSYSAKGDVVRIYATVEEVNYYDYSMNALLRLKSADGKAVRGRLLLELKDFVSFKELDQVELVADISVYPERSASLLAGSPNRSRDIFLSGTPSPETQINVTPAPPSLSHSLKGLRDGIQYILEENIWREGDYPSAQASLACGIFLGERDNISYAVRGDFNRTGISHILSVSGMHLTILMGTLFALLCAFGIHRRAACVMVMAAALFYMALCGFLPSATRAGIMALFYYTALLFGRDSHAPSSLFMAGCAICAVNPYTVADISFMLSFLATLGIVTVSPTLSRISEAARERSRLLVPFAVLLSGFGITAAAVLFTLPVTLSVFGTMSLVSPVVNLAAAPFVQLILVLSPLLALFSFLPFAAGLLSSVIYVCCDILTRLAHLCPSRTGCWSPFRIPDLPW